MRITKLEGATIISIDGNKKTPEKAETIIKFPTGEVSITRTSDNKYWIHAHVRKDAESDLPISKIIDARLDIIGKHTSENNVGDFGHEGLYHFAVLTELI